MQKAVTKITDEKKHLMTKTEEEPIESDGTEPVPELLSVCISNS